MIMTKIQKHFRSIALAKQLFSSTIDYSHMPLRYVCRYHLFIEEGDYSLRDKLCHPFHGGLTRNPRLINIQARASLYLELLNNCSDEIEQCYQMGVFDFRFHYDSAKNYLRYMRFLIRHHPILFAWIFR